MKRQSVGAKRCIITITNKPHLLFLPGETIPSLMRPKRFLYDIFTFLLFHFE